MKKQNILFLSSEVYPFAKTGGLADVSNSLPKALKELGHEVRIMMPKYKVVNERRFVLREVIRLKDIPIQVGDTVKKINVKSGFTPDPVKIQTYFIDYKPFFGREGLYVDAKKKTDYKDNDERFILFSKGVLETLKLLFWQPDIIHCNDWQTSLVPYLLKTAYKDDEFFKNTSTLLTVHNVGFQGNFPKETFDKLNVEGEKFTKGCKLEYHDQFSFLKTGIYNADFVSTVSPTYAKEITESAEYGFGFEDFFKDRKKQFEGILNGIDETIWNPETDTLIPENYSIRTVKQKEENKKALLERCGLPYQEGRAVIGMVSRMTDQKGFDLISNAAEKLLALDVQFVQLGTGDLVHQKMFKDWAKKHPEKVSANFEFDDELAHLIEAGADIFLMPSKYEPCGLNQMFSLKYGTVPVARNTGGLTDTVERFNIKDCSGTGFLFEKYEVDEMITALERALEVYKDAKLWNKLRKNGMKKDFSWSSSAKKYVKLYDQISKSNS